MMTRTRGCAGQGPFAARFVGDPVDVVTGANVDRNLDFRMTGPIPLEWYRHYDSSLAGTRFGLGWGHAHGFERYLVADMDGMRYVGPLGRGAGFPWLEHDGDEAASGGFGLLRVSERLWRVREHGQPTMEFALPPRSEVATLSRLVWGTHAIAFTYDDDARLRTITDSAGRVLNVRTDAEGRVTMVSQVMPQGQPERLVLAYQFDEQGNLARAGDAFRSIFGFRWDAAHRVIERTDRNGYAFRFAYDDAGRCVRTSGADGLLDVQLRYLPEERVTVATRADGGAWQYFYDENGSLLLVVDPYGGQRKFIPGESTSVELDPAGNEVAYITGAAGPIAKVDALGRIMPVPADPNRPGGGHRVAQNAAEYELGWLFSQGERMLGPAPARWHELPPEIGRVIGDPPPQPPATVPAYPVKPLYTDWWPAPRAGRIFDDFGHLVQQRDAAGRHRRWLYDAAGNVRQHVDFDGGRWATEYTSWNLRTRELDPLGGETRYSWTPTENVASVADPGGTVSEYGWDLKDRMVSVRRHGALKERYEYDAADNLLAKYGPDGTPLLRLEVGPANLVLKKVLSSGETHAYEYDDAGRYTAIAAGDERTEFAYDPYGHCVAELRDGLGVEHSFSGLDEPFETRVLGFTIRYGWSRGARTITDPTGATTRIESLGRGLVWRSTPAGSDEAAVYDEMGRCTRKVLQRRQARSRPWTRRFAYSGEGDLVRTEDDVLGNAEYAYDAAHRLVAARSAAGEQRFGYDAAGNLLEQPGLRNVRLRPGNRLATVDDDAFEYDDRNRLASRSGPAGDTRYTYDSRDRLRRCESPAGEWAADYDPFARRTRVRRDDEETRYYWDDDRLAGEIRPDGSVRVYVYAAPLALTPIAFVDYDSLDAAPGSGRRYDVFCNQIGAPVLVEDARGQTAWRARMDAYGQTHVEAGATVELALRWPGHHYDDATGLHYNRFRYYSPELGRYLQSDPLGITGGLNLYAYPASPLAKVDVRGETCPECEAAKAQAEKDQRDMEENPALRTAQLGDEEGARRLASAAGMDPNHLAAMQQLSKETGTVHILRDTNPVTPARMAQRRRGELDALPKGHDVLLKTDKTTGLVTQAANPGAEPPPGYHFDQDGVLRDSQGHARYGDHDLQGVYRENPPGSGNWESPMGTTKTTDHDAPPQDGPYVDNLNNRTGGDMYQHGPNDNYRNADGTGPGRDPGPNEHFTVVDENGQAQRTDVNGLKQYYDDRGIPWPYSVPPYS